LVGLAALVAAGGVVAAFDREPASRLSQSGVKASAPAGGESLALSDVGAAMGGTTGGGTAAAAGGGGGQAAPTPSAVPTVGPKVVKTAEIRVRVARRGFSDAFDEAAAVAARYQGFVADSSTNAAGRGGASGSLTIRVPAAAFDAARRDLRGLGKVETESISGQDVSGQLVDFDARILSLQAQEEALRTLMGRGNQIGELLQVQNQLFTVRQQIEQLQAQRNQLDDAASLATLRLSLFEPATAAREPGEPEPATGLARDLRRAWHGAAAVVGGMVIVVGYTLPLALLALLGWLVFRVLARRRPVAAA
jgi:hypothetical protein